MKIKKKQENKYKLDTLYLKIILWMCVCVLGRVVEGGGAKADSQNRSLT